MTSVVRSGNYAWLNPETRPRVHLVTKAAEIITRHHQQRWAAQIRLSAHEPVPYGTRKASAAV
jgi:hypothetical protein